MGSRLTKIGCLGVCLALLCGILSAESKSENYSPDETYYLYLAQNWTQLLATGRAVLDSGVDYYYLRIRLGMAHYHLKHYRLAAEQFKRALQFDSESPEAREFLYYSYLFSGQRADAQAQRVSFTPEESTELNFGKEAWIGQVEGEAGWGFSPAISRYSNTDFDGLENIYGEADLVGNQNYQQVGLFREVGSSLAFYGGIGQVMVNRRKIIQQQDQVQTQDYRVRQQQFYISTSIRLARGWMVVPAFSLLCVSKAPLVYRSSGITVIDTTFTDHVVCLSIEHELSKFTISLQGTYGNINGAPRHQIGGIITLYPLANLDLYTTTNLSLLWSNGQHAQVLSQLLGGKVIDHLWGEISGAWGDMRNYTDKNGFVVYNTTDKINSRWEASLIGLIGSRLELSLRYQYCTREDNYIIYRSIVAGDYATRPLKYSSQSLLGGIKWKL